MLLFVFNVSENDELTRYLYQFLQAVFTRLLMFLSIFLSIVLNIYIAKEELSSDG